ncbi:MAG: hypothetical protein PSX71_12040 [bacterium]|nr:hypothetical protein [bacterium]
MNHFANRQPVSTVIALLSGLLFGTGLILSGMTTPANVLAFLDVAGHWNPALAIVMGTAVAVAAPAFWLVRRRQHTLLGAATALSNRKPVDKTLLAGSAIFGAGWGLSGICPGPGLVIAASGSTGALVFVAGMGIGMLIVARLQRTPVSTDDTLPETEESAEPCG